MRVSVVVATYNQPEWLEKVLWGYAYQSYADFELVIADDGSGAPTAELLARAAPELGLDVVHVWHEDSGFRKCEILNRAILAARGDYLIFSDGDCIPRRDFVELHARLARPRRFLSGGYLKLPLAVSRLIAADDVRSGRFCDLAWLRRSGWSPGRHALRLLPEGSIPAVLDRFTPTRASWNGHNASTWRDALLAVNGFDGEMRYGGLDRALGERLQLAGLRGVQIRHRAPVLHLDHPRPYLDRAAMRRNLEIRRRYRRNRELRAKLGIAELAGSDEPTVIRRLRAP